MRALFICLFLAPSVATAQWIAPEQPSDGDRAQASERFANGIEALDRQRWNVALAAFEEAYALAGSPEALLGIARALRELDEADRADAALDRILRTSTDEDLRRDAEALRAPHRAASPFDAIPWIVAGAIAIVAAALVIGFAIWQAGGLQPMSAAVLRL